MNGGLELSRDIGNAGLKAGFAGLRPGQAGPVTVFEGGAFFLGQSAPLFIKGAKLLGGRHGWRLPGEPDAAEGGATGWAVREG